MKITHKRSESEEDKQTPGVYTRESNFTVHPGIYTKGEDAGIKFSAESYIKHMEWHESKCAEKYANPSIETLRVRDNDMVIWNVDIPSDMSAESADKYVAKMSKIFTPIIKSKARNVDVVFLPRRD